MVAILKPFYQEGEHTEIIVYLSLSIKVINLKPIIIIQNYMDIF